MGTVTTLFEPVGRSGDVSTNQTLLEAAHHLGVDLISLCGGQGTCGRCRLQVVEGRVSPPSSRERETLSREDLEQGCRLACQTYPRSDVTVRVPPSSLSSSQRLQTEGLMTKVEFEPAARSYEVELSPPSLSDDLTDDLGRVTRALEQNHDRTCRSVDVDVARTISPDLRSWDWCARATLYEEELIALSSPSGLQLALAVDLGTTKIAGYLVDMERGETLTADGVMNPQTAYGEDIITRISYARKSTEHAARLRQDVVDALNRLAHKLCQKTDTDRLHIVDMVLVGNTAMHHLFLGLPTEQLVRSPYVPAVSRAMVVKARDAGLELAPGAYVRTLPNVAGYVGADHVAMLLATDLQGGPAPALALDIGTNTEICLSADGKLTSVSCASGPAFEGAHIEHGMRAASGAIERLDLMDGDVTYRTVDGAPPVGLCGSGILDAVAGLYSADIVDIRGAMDRSHKRVRVTNGRPEFVLVEAGEAGNQRAITVTQRDVREVLLAKGAIRAGIEVLLRAQGLRAEELESVVIAGAFGCYISVSSAVKIGLLPDLPLGRFKPVGNAAGAGARLAMLSQDKWADAQRLARRIEYIELATVPDFDRIMARASYLGEGPNSAE